MLSGPGKDKKFTISFAYLVITSFQTNAMRKANAAKRAVTICFFVSDLNFSVVLVILFFGFLFNHLVH